MLKFRGVILLLLALAMWTRSTRIPYFIGYLLVVPLALAVAARRFGLRKLRAVRSVRQKAVFCGETADVKVTLTNTGRIPIPWAAFSDDLPGGLQCPEGSGRVISLGAREQVSLQYPVRGLRRGFYRLRSARVVVGDIFGLGEESFLCGGDEPLTVYPRVHPLPAMILPTRLPFGRIRSHDRVFEDPNRVVGVRDYQPGDAESRIHWKVSARAGRLQVKEYQPTISLRTALFVDLSPEHYSRRRWAPDGELAIELAASLVYHLSGLGEGCALFSNGRDSLLPDSGEPPAAKLPGRSGRGGAEEALSLLARLEMAEGVPLVQLAADCAKSLPWGATLFFIVPEDDQDLLSLCLGLARRGFEPFILVVERDVFHAELTRAPGLGGVRALSVFKGVEGGGLRFA